MKPRAHYFFLSSLVACAGAESPPPSAPPSPSSAPSAAALPAPPASAEGASTKASVAPVAEAKVAAQLSAKAVPLPRAKGPVSLDYLAFERSRARVWVPVGDTGSAAVFDIATGTFSSVDGFKSTEREYKGRKRMMGPSAASAGDGVVYVGNRATSEVCAVDAKTLKLGHCLKLPSATDGVVYVPSAKEVWVTTPRDQSLTVLDASKPDALKPKLVIKTPGEPEGYAIDEGRGIFYTNLEDKDRTIGIDIKSHAIKSNWSAGCGEDGPRGVAVDSARNFVFVACTAAVVVQDGGHDGAVLAKLDTGAGVDNIDYVPGTKLLYVAAGKDARLTVARISDKGQPAVVATAATAEGARNAVVDERGNVYVADPKGASLIVVAAPAGAAL